MPAKKYATRKKYKEIAVYLLLVRGPPVVPVSRFLTSSTIAGRIRLAPMLSAPRAKPVSASVLDRASRARPQQEIIPGERDDRWKNQNDKLRWKCERANKRAIAVKKENDSNVANDEANNARHEWHEAQPNRRRMGMSGIHHLTRLRPNFSAYLNYRL
jgi:hypothetical protein